MERFKSTDISSFVYSYDRVLKPNETVIVQMPRPSANKRSVNDIGWMSNSDGLTLYGTLSAHPSEESEMWQEISSFDEVNKTVSALKIINGPQVGRIIVRAILC